MKSENELKVIKKALEHTGLLATKELEFVEEINLWPDSWTLTPGQATYLFNIGERKLDMIIDRNDTGTNLQPVANHYRKGVCA